MDIDVLTKPGCGKCLAAKGKLQLMKLSYTEHKATEERLAHYGMQEANLPVIVIDDCAYDYPGAMKVLKETLDAR